MAACLVQIAIAALQIIIIRRSFRKTKPPQHLTSIVSMSQHRNFSDNVRRCGLPPDWEHDVRATVYGHQPRRNPMAEEAFRAKGNSGIELLQGWALC